MTQPVKKTSEGGRGGLGQNQAPARLQRRSGRSKEPLRLTQVVKHIQRKDRRPPFAGDGIGIHRAIHIFGLHQITCHHSRQKLTGDANAGTQLQPTRASGGLAHAVVD